MSLLNLKNALTDLACFAEISGGKKAAVDLNAISEFLSGASGAQAETSINELASLIEEHKDNMRAHYIRELNAAATDFNQFESVHAALKADKSITKEDLDKIAHGYTLGRLKWKNRKAALDAIKDRFEERVYQASKMKIVERYKVG